MSYNLKLIKLSALESFKEPSFAEYNSIRLYLTTIICSKRGSNIIWTMSVSPAIYYKLVLNAKESKNIDLTQNTISSLVIEIKWSFVKTQNFMFDPGLWWLFSAINWVFSFMEGNVNILISFEVFTIAKLVNFYKFYAPAGRTLS